MEIRAELFGEEIVHRRLMGIGDRAGNMAPALREVARLWMDLEQELFDSEGASGGKPWAPTKSGDGQTLVDTGRLMRSLTERGAEDQILEINDHWLVLGTGHEAAIHHHHGTTDMDARPPIQISPQGRRQTVKVIQRFLVEGKVGRSL